MTSLRVHQILLVTEANGPGKRFALWVQGCAGVPQPNDRVGHCQGCWNPQAWSQKAGKVYSVDKVFDRIQDVVREYSVEGVTFSGGEPFQQAEGLAELAGRCQEQGLNVLVFTGYTIEFVRFEAAPTGSAELLKHTDLLVDGPYVEALRTEDLPLRGSANQRLVPLTAAGEELVAWVTNELPVVEFSFFDEGKVTVTGFPLKEVI